MFVALRDAIDLCKLPLPPFWTSSTAVGATCIARRFLFRGGPGILPPAQRVAGSAGPALFGHHDPVVLRYAADFHTALQLTRFLQDLSVDLPHNRCFIPSRTSTTSGSATPTWLRSVAGPLDEAAARSWRDLLNYQAMRAVRCCCAVVPCRKASRAMCAPTCNRVRGGPQAAL